MSADDLSKQANEFVRSIWGDRELGMEVPALDLTQPVSHAEINALLDKFAFLQMISSNPDWSTMVIPRFHLASSGWIVHDYGQAMSSSAGPQLFGPGNPEAASIVQSVVSNENSTEGDGGDSGDTGKGTYVKQAVDTAEAMIEWAISKGWPGVEIVAGTHFMQWAAWMAAQERSYPVTGFQPTEKERQKSDRIRRLRAGRGSSIRPAPTPGS